MNANQIYQEMQKEWVKLTGLKSGDTVRITREYKDGEQGFTIGHHPSVGNEYTIVGVTDQIVCFGVNVPYYILEILPEKPKTVKLNNREIVKDGDNIVCGCCRLTPAEAKKAVTAFNVLSTMFKSYSFQLNVEGSVITRDNIEALKALM